ncbi:MAG TPA: alpha/beta hydrolase [Longimicrobiales bacterium]|nr:alpha/beta hydrolase [Longimicrobiales bacterium]
MATSFVENGTSRIAYTVVGSGPPILFIQGIGLHGAGWKPQVDELSATHTCVYFDNAGVGGSQPLVGQLSIRRMAEDALRVMDAAGIESARLVGHSMGGSTAVECALIARQRVRSLSLLCTFAVGKDATRLTPRMLWVGLRTTFGSVRSRRRAFLELVLAPGDLPLSERDRLAEELEPIFGYDLARRPPVAMKQLAALRAYDPGARLSELAGIPCLVASATHDPIAFPDSGRRLAAAIPGARYVEFPNHSHGVVIRDAKRVNALLREHFERAEQERSTSHAPATGQ